MIRRLSPALPLGALALGVLALAGPGAVTAASPAPSTASAAAIGPQIGSKVPLAARLSDSAGKPTTLGAIAAGKPMMIVLFRSAAWCPYCQRQLKGLGPVAAAAAAKGMRFAALSYDKPETLAAFSAKQGLAYPLFSDGGSRLIDALKLRDPQYPAGNIAYGVPYPTILVIDAQGRVKAKSVETDYKIRPSEADLIAMLDKA